MKVAVYRDLEAGGGAPGHAEAIVVAMLRAMVRREPAIPVVAPIEGGAVGAWVENRDPEDAVLEAVDDGSFAIGDGLLLRPHSAAALLAAVRARGEEAIRDMDGSFAAVVHDATARRTYIASDRFATRPLYVHDDGRRFTAASEAKALFAIPGLEPREEPLAIFDLLNYGYLIGDRTWFEGVKLIEEATAIVLPAGRRPERRRYRSRLFTPGALPESEGLEAIADAFERGVRDLARRVENPAMLLSGGLDSRTITSFCARAGVPLTCYTFGPAGAAEVVAAQGIARALGYPIERCETPNDLLPRNAAVAEWVCDGHVSLSDIHFLDHHVRRMGPEHGGFFDGWLGGVIGGAYYVRQSDFALRTKEDLAGAIKGMLDFTHPVPLEDEVYEPSFARRLRERAGDSVREFLADWDITRDQLPAAKEAACLRFRDRRWQLYHNGIAAEPFNRGLRPYVLGDIVERFQALPLEARMNARFYQKLLLKHFPHVAKVTWSKTGRAIGKPQSRAIDSARRWKAKLFYYVGRLSKGAFNLRDLARYQHYDQAFCEDESLRRFFEFTLIGDPKRRPYLRQGSIALLLSKEAQGGRYYEMLCRLLQIELVRRLFFGELPALARLSLLPEKIGRVRLRGPGTAQAVGLAEQVGRRRTRASPA